MFALKIKSSSISTTGECVSSTAMIISDAPPITRIKIIKASCVYYTSNPPPSPARARYNSPRAQHVWIEQTTLRTAEGQKKKKKKGRRDRDTRNKHQKDSKPGGRKCTDRKQDQAKQAPEERKERASPTQPTTNGRERLQDIHGETDVTVSHRYHRRRGIHDEIAGVGKRRKGSQQADNRDRASGAAA